MAATDVLTLEQAKAVLDRTPSDLSDDAAIALLVGAVSDRLDRACGPIVQRDVTDEQHLHVAGCSVLRLRHQPVASIISIEEYRSSTPTALAPDTLTGPGDYALQPWWTSDPPGLHTGKVMRRGGFRGPVEVSYVAGRYEDAQAVEGTRFAEAAAVLLVFLAQRKNVGVAEVNGYDTPTSVFPLTTPAIIRQILAHDWTEGVVVR